MLRNIQLRKNRPNVQVGDYVVIYATAPVKAVIGFGKIKNIIDKSPENMWKANEEKLGINKKEYDKYYADSNRAIGIEISSICRFKIGLLLTEIKELHPKFSPPQTYRYISNIQALRTYKAII